MQAHCLWGGGQNRGRISLGLWVPWCENLPLEKMKMPFIQQQQQQHRCMLKTYFEPGAGTYGIFKHPL